MASPIPGNAPLRVGRGVLLFNPTIPDPVDIDLSHPTLILIFGWMGAKLSHLQKYISVYREKYPNTSIWLIRSEPSFFWSTEYQRQKALAFVVEALTSAGCIPSSYSTPSKTLEPRMRQRILVHAFSNGGCFQLTTLGKILSADLTTSSTSSMLIPTAVVLDSCPGQAGLTATQRAFTIAVANPLARIMIKTIVTFFFCLELILRYIFHKQPPVELMKSNLNKPGVLPWMGKGTPRLYIYSSGDQLVPSNAVEQHIAEANRMGLNVYAEKFGKESNHVAHARADPQRYWTAIERVWKEALVSEK